MKEFITGANSLFSAEIAEVLKQKIFALENWQWLILIVGITLGVALKPLIQLILKFIKEHNFVSKKFPQSFSAYLLQSRIEKPLSWILVSLFWLSLASVANLPEGFHKGYLNVMRALIGFNAIWFFYVAVGALGATLSAVASKTQSTMDDQLVPFVTKTLKVMVVILGILIIVQNFGLNVMSLLAGLGLGGLALALAAQDTAANVFGSITILVDQPFKVGDYIKVGAIEGDVESIGFRSTRVRTFYNSLVTIPNSVMAKENIDNLGIRPARRVRQILGIAYETPPDRIEEFCDRIRYMVRQHPDVIQDTVITAFQEFADSSLNILLNFHVRVFTLEDELKHKQTLYLDILRLGAEMGVSFAYPTQTVYYQNMGKSSSNPPALQQ